MGDPTDRSLHFALLLRPPSIFWISYNTMRVTSVLVQSAGKKRRSLLGAIAPLLIAVGAAAVLWTQIKGFDGALVASLLQDIALWQWASALVFTAISFITLAQYDAFWHKALNTGVSASEAKRSGFAAIAIGQTIGMCSITSSLVRWRCLPHLSPLTIAGLSAAVSASFMAIWFVCAAFAAWLLMAPLAGFEMGPVPAAAIGGALLVGSYLALQKTTLTVIDLLRLTILVLVDIAAAATVLWVLLPVGTEVGWLALVAGFVLALGAGIVSNSPGGVGPFELVLITALPSLPTETALAAVVAYRLVYFLVPFLIALPIVIWKKDTKRLEVSGPADWKLAAQSGQIRRFGQSWAHVLKVLPGLYVSLGDPEPAGLSRRGLLSPPKGLHAIYKSSAPLALAARKQGWFVSLIAREATLDPQCWTPNGSDKKRLRQSLRKAADAGVTIEETTDLPLDEMTKIAAAWAKSRGGELGATMGRFDPTYVKDQRVFLIRAKQTICGFVTFHTARDWSMDLVRHSDDIPEGAIQAAVVTAIETAKREGITRLSLGAVPAEDGPLSKWCASKGGLAQFKRRFSPKWEPRYLICRNAPLQLLIASYLLVAIQRPMSRAATQVMRKTHDKVAKFEFASSSRARDTGTDADTKDASCSPPQTHSSPF